MSDYPAQQQLVAALLDPRRYPHAANKVRLLETHISWVLLAGRYAYKIKKAVDLGFLDFTDLQARHRYCDEEIRLNRRLAPQLYLGTVAIGGTPDAPLLADDTLPAIEYAVKMRRFAAGALLNLQLARGRLAPRHLDRLAATLADFHAGLPPAAADTAYGSAARIHADALQNFEQLAALLRDTQDVQLLAEVRALSEREYAHCAETFERRRSLGCVRECHGDLHLGNIALLGDEALPFDGIEFNAELRWIDVINEVAFLAMDLQHHGRPELAFRFLNAWFERSGDYAGIAVLRFYCGYRAMVRAKVGAIRASQPGIGKRAAANALTDCRSHLRLAAQLLRQRRPALIITHGLPGSGKTTFAQAALERLPGFRIRSDVERKRLFGLQAHEDSRSAIDGGIYGAPATAQTYARLLELARQILATGYAAIVDAAFLKREERERFHALAQELHVPFAIASLQAEDDALRERVAQRAAGAADASEADLEVLAKLTATQQPLGNAELAHAVLFRNEAGTDLTRLPAWQAMQALLGGGA